MNKVTMINMIKRKWMLSGYGSSIDDSIAEQYLIDAVYQVEGLDCPTGTDFTVNNDVITFTNGDPDNDVSMVYVFCALSQIQKAYLKGLLDDGAIGVTVKSGLESVSSSAASGLHNNISVDFESQYKSALNRLKIKNITSGGMVNIYNE